MKEEIFLSVMGVFLIFNTFVALVNPSVSSVLNMDLIGILLTAITIIGAGSLLVIVVGETVIKIVFSTLVIFNVLFQVNIYGFNIGIGLASTMINVFNNGDVLGIGTIIGGTLSFIAFVSGMLMVAGDS